MSSFVSITKCHWRNITRIRDLLLLGPICCILFSLTNAAWWVSCAEMWGGHPMRLCFMYSQYTHSVILLPCHNLWSDIVGTLSVKVEPAKVSWISLHTQPPALSHLYLGGLFLLTFPGQILHTPGLCPQWHIDTSSHTCLPTSLGSPIY